MSSEKLPDFVANVEYDNMRQSTEYCTILCTYTYRVVFSLTLHIYYFSVNSGFFLGET